MTPSNSGPAATLRRYLRLHVVVYLAVVAVSAAVDLTLSDIRWFHWPAMVWGAVLCVHILYCKSLSVDEGWAEARADKLRERSYDLGHIMSIEESYKNSAEATAPDDQPATDRPEKLRKQ